jgi:hypothetical protein
MHWLQKNIDVIGFVSPKGDDRSPDPNGKRIASERSLMKDLYLGSFKKAHFKKTSREFRTAVLTCSDRQDYSRGSRVEQT